MVATRPGQRRTFASDQADFPAVSVPLSMRATEGGGGIEIAPARARDGGRVGDDSAYGEPPKIDSAPMLTAASCGARPTGMLGTCPVHPVLSAPLHVAALISDMKYRRRERNLIRNVFVVLQTPENGELGQSRSRSMMSSATWARSLPTMSGAAPSGERTIPGRATNAARAPAASAPDTSHAWAATSRTSESATPH